MHTVREETVVVTERVASRLPAIKQNQNQQSVPRLNLSIQSPDSFLSLGLARLGKITEYTHAKMFEVAPICDDGALAELTPQQIQGEHCQAGTYECLPLHCQLLVRCCIVRSGCNQHHDTAGLSCPFDGPKCSALATTWTVLREHRQGERDCATCRQVNTRLFSSVACLSYLSRACLGKSMVFHL